MIHCDKQKRLKKQLSFTCKVLLLVSTMFCLTVPAALAQEKAVKGTVVDVNNQPMIGVNVVVKAKNTGVVTDIDGKFSINVTDKDVLVFSFVGYNTEEVAVGTQTQITVTLKESVKELNEVVVVGYGVQKKSDLTGAIASVSGESIEKTPMMSSSQALEGRAAGIQVIAATGAPGANISVDIRGISSINGYQPLYIIDGVAGDINTVAPSDIQSIEILKDASSAAIYGANGAAGVVLITTKKGQAGKIVTNFDYYYGWQTPWKEIDMASGPEFARMADAVQILNTGNPATTLRYPNPASMPTYNYQDIVFHTAGMENYDFNVSGGSDKATFMLSGAYTTQDGIVHNSDYNRYSVRLNSEYNSTPWLKIGENASVVKTQYNGFQEWQLTSEYASPVYGALQMEPIIPPYYPPDSSQRWGISPSNISNPQGTIDICHYQQNNYTLNGSFYAIVEPIKGLTLETKISPSIYFGDTYNFTPIYYINGQSNNSQDIIERTSDKSQGWTWQNIATYTKTLFDDYHMSLMAGYESSDWTDINMDGTAKKLPNETPEMQYFSMADTITSLRGGGQETRGYSQFYRANLDWKGIILLTSNFRRDASSLFGPNNRFGNFPSVSGGIKFSELDFFKKLGFLSFGKIRAGWGTVGNNTLNPYAYFATVGTGSAYYAFQYPFNNTSVTDGAALNKIPNPDIHWETMVQTDVGVDLGFLANKLSVTIDYFERHNNEMLYPATPAGDLGYIVRAAYQENNSITPNEEMNIGKIENSGVETSIGWKDSKGKFKYSIDFNYTYINNKVIKLNNDSILAGQLSTISGYATITAAGGQIGEFYGYKTDGLYKQSDVDPNTGLVVDYYDKNGNPVTLNPKAKPGDIKFVDINKDGKLNASDVVPIGNPNPKDILGLSMNFEYGPFDMSLFFQGVFGNKIFDANLFSECNYNGEANWSQDYINNMYVGTAIKDASGNILVPVNLNGTLPRLDPSNSNHNTTVFSDFYIKDGSYVRLKNMQIGYTLPKVWTMKAGIDALRVYVGGQNLLTFTKYPGFDPEVGPSGDPKSVQHNVLSGFDVGNYPQARMFTVGVNLRF
jgi:TonB-linked SusC/RagA family outer membrane protein